MILDLSYIYPIIEILEILYFLKFRIFHESILSCPKIDLTACGLLEYD